MSRIEHVLDFWFAEENRPYWFLRDPGFDERVRLRLGELTSLALERGLDGWSGSPRGSLALVILLDQAPRNLYRGEAKAYAGDPLALEAAAVAVDRGFDRQLKQIERLFLYLPFEHSEALADQERCCELMADLDEDPGWLDYALQHKRIIERFGRFPHRNAVLGRASSAEELEFLEKERHSFF